jgi:hypothetical protein
MVEVLQLVFVRRLESLHNKATVGRPRRREGRKSESMER